MRFLAVLSLAVLATSASCVVWHDYPAVDLPSHAGVKSQLLYYRINLPTVEISKPWMKDYRETVPSQSGLELTLDKAFKTNPFGVEARGAPMVVGKGLFCDLTMTSPPLSEGMMWWWFIASQSAAGPMLVIPPFIIPFFTPHGVPLLFRYDLYEDGHFIHTYEYTVTAKAAIWIGLLPFIWLNLFFTSQEDALQATVYRFLADAERDKYLVGGFSSSFNNVNVGHRGQ